MAEEKLTLKTSLESSQFVKGAKKVKTALGSIGKAASTLGATMSAAMAVQAVKAMVTFAGEAEKTDLRMKRVFGSMSSEVDGFATSLSGNLGRVKSDIQSGLVSFQAFFQGLGFGREEAAKYSQQMQALSLDLASFFQIQDANAQKRFLAALAGSPEVLDQFGINLKEARLETELLSMGISTTVQKTDELTKTNARLSVIMQAMTDNGIVGDAKRTMDTYGNKVTIAQSSIKELGIAIGDTFIPAAKDMLGIVIQLTDNITKLFGTEKKLLDLNKDQQDEFKLVSDAIVSTIKSGGDYSILLDHIIGKYPKYLGGLDKSTMSAKDLTKRIEELNKAFELQNKIYTINNKIADLTKKRDESKQKVFKQQLKVQEILNTKSKHGLEFNEKKLTKESGLIEKATDAQEALNDALAEEIRLKELKKAMPAFDVIYQSVDPVAKNIKPKRLSDGGVQFDPKSKGDTDEFTDLADMERLIDGLSAIPKKIPKIKLLFKDYFSLGGIDFVRDTIIKDGELIQQSFIDLQGTMANALEGFASNMGQAFGGAIQTALKGGANLGTAIRLATKEALGGMAADLAANAMYFGILALGYKAGIIATGGATGASAASAAKSAGIFAAGATLLGGVSAAISGKGGGGTTPSSRNTGGSANGGTGVGGGTFTDFMDSIRGEQVFRLAGNDLVTAINRTNTFQGSIGG